MREAVAGAIDHALDFLKKSQLPSGQFPGQLTVRPDTGADVGAPGTHADISPFCTSYIATVLLTLNDHRATEMAKFALDFLEREKVRGGTWRYWCKGTVLHEQIPPDVDDTACVSTALRAGGRKIPDNIRVILANRRTDGLFYTWIALRPRIALDLRWLSVVLRDINYARLVGFWRGGAQRGDVDATVNANVLIYLGKRPETRAAVRWIRDVAHSGREAESDKWYRSSAAFYYAVSRCSEIAPGELLDLREQMSRSFGLRNGPEVLLQLNELHRSMALSAIMNYGMRLSFEDQIVDSLCDAQNQDGSWPAHPIYYDGREDPLISFASAAMTTGLCIEALNKSFAERR
jgi:hypothetical protein